MSFLRKKKVKFNVEMIIQELTDVPLLNAVIFAKVRLLDCGSFIGVTLHRPVISHQVDFMYQSPSQYHPSHNIRLRVRTISGQTTHVNPNLHRHSTTGLIDDMALFNPTSGQSHIGRRHSFTEKSPREYLDKQEEITNHQSNDVGERTHDEIAEEFVDEHGNVVPVEKNPQPFEFVCYIPYEKSTGELEECRCKISLRKEDRAGRTPQKLGFVILNLSEFAGSGSEGVIQSFLLEGYRNSQRQDNSRVHVYIRMQHNSADPLFKVPNSAMLFRHQNGSLEDISQQNESFGSWLNPADRKAPPPSPIPPTSSANTLQLQLTTSTSTNPSSVTNPVQTDSGLHSSAPSGTGTSTATSHSGNVSSAFPTVPGGLGHNMSMRVQQTRTDPSVVVEELIAENSATIVRRHSSSTSSGEYESS